MLESSKRAALLTDHVGAVLTPYHARKMLLGGDCTMTVVSEATGKAFTFRVKRAPDKNGRKSDLFFFSVLTGPDNSSNFSYLGTIHPVLSHEQNQNWFDYRAGSKCKIAQDAPAWKAWVWFYRHTQSLDLLWRSGIKVLHAGRCCVCGRKLTRLESIIEGIGPECAGRE